MLANPLCCREVAEACKIESLGFPIEEADPHAAGDTCQEAEAKLNREGRLPRRPYCFEDHEYQRAGRCGCPNQ
jgi:hypothetical protein